MVAAENDALPGAKVGGVADVVRDIPKALAEQGCSVDVIIPDYGFGHLNRQHIGQLNVQYKGALHQLSVYKIESTQSGVYQFVISHHLFSDAGGAVYCNDAPGRPFATDASKYALFNAAVCEGLLQGIFRRPDALHLHDWHSALVAVLIKYSARYKPLQAIHTAYTVHNLALQGIRPFKHDDSSLEAWFEDLTYDRYELCDPRYSDCFNPMRSAINLADKVHLVSPTYSQEVLKASNYEQGFFGGEGLERDLQNKANASNVVGILNGCEYTEIPAHNETQHSLYNQIEQSLFIWMATQTQVQSSHYIAHQRLQQFKSSKSTGPLITSVGRLTEQKVLLLAQQYDQTLMLDKVCELIAQFKGRLIILGSGDSDLEALFCKAMARNSNFLFLKGYAQGVGDTLYQLGDLFLMPSSFEPCGISQMLAMRAGQPCLVHSVGGLKDTVVHNETGFCFTGDSLNKQNEALLSTLESALSMHKKQPKQWLEIAKNAQSQRFSWDTVAQDYIKYLYR